MQLVRDGTPVATLRSVGRSTTSAPSARLTGVVYTIGVSLGYFDGDAFCDVMVGDVLFPEGQTLQFLTPLPRPNLLRR